MDFQSYQGSRVEGNTVRSYVEKTGETFIVSPLMCSPGNGSQVIGSSGMGCCNRTMPQKAVVLAPGSHTKSVFCSGLSGSPPWWSLTCHTFDIIKLGGCPTPGWFFYPLAPSLWMSPVASCLPFSHFQALYLEQQHKSNPKHNHMQLGSFLQALPRLLLSSSSFSFQSLLTVPPVSNVISLFSASSSFT